MIYTNYFSKFSLLKRLRQIKKIKVVITLSLVLFSLSSNAYTEEQHIAHNVDGYNIPIVIKLPNDLSTPRPVIFYIHGGGWKGGDDINKTLPGAITGNTSAVLCDELGIIYVGLAYRCRGNNATFQDAISDLQASVAWFYNQVSLNVYNADLTKIGFEGDSAGSTLAALMSQNYSECKVFIGYEGMYDLTVNDNSDFPNATARSEYGLDTTPTATTASAYHNLAITTPPSAYLFHGLDDYLCDHNQSTNFAQAIIDAGGDAIVKKYENINHSCVNIDYPEVFEETVRLLAPWLAEKFELPSVDTSSIDSLSYNLVKDYYPKAPTLVTDIIGTWDHWWQGTVSFSDDGTGLFLHAGEVLFNYEIVDNKIIATAKDNSITRTYFFRIKDNALCEYVSDVGPLLSRREKYNYLGAPTIPIVGNYYDTCDFTSSWYTNSGNILSLSTTNPQEGVANLEMTGSGDFDFYNLRFTPYDSGATAENGIVKFWYYVDNTALIQDFVWFYLGSGGADGNRYQWYISKNDLVSGLWNYIELNFTNRFNEINGTPDFSALNFFAVQIMGKLGVMTTGLDAIQVEPAETLGILEHNLINDVSIYPNPTQGKFIVNLKKLGDTELSIFDITGRIVFNQEVNVNSDSNNTIPVDLSSMQSGLYYVKLKSSKRELVKKVLIK